MMKGTIVYGEVAGFVCEEYGEEYRYLLYRLIELKEENQELQASLRKERKVVRGMKELIKSMEKDMVLLKEAEKYCRDRKDMLYLVQ